MITHNETRFLPYTQQQLFDLVADIEQYPEFLPWCIASRIVERSDAVVKADLVVGYKSFREQFTSVVTLIRPVRIEVAYASGPLSHLHNHWTFAEVSGGCDLGFDLAFAFKNPFLASMFGPFLEKALKQMSQAFETRAHALYGSTNNESLENG
jgi:coenzyme Q-binding protein COQ10